MAQLLSISMEIGWSPLVGFFAPSLSLHSGGNDYQGDTSSVLPTEVQRKLNPAIRQQLWILWATLAELLLGSQRTGGRHHAASIVLLWLHLWSVRWIWELEVVPVMCRCPPSPVSILQAQLVHFFTPTPPYRHLLGLEDRAIPGFQRPGVLRTGRVVHARNATRLSCSDLQLQITLN